MKYLNRKFQQGGVAQQGGQDAIVQQVSQALQKGMKPEEVLRALVKQGMAQEQATQLIKGIMQQMQGGTPSAKQGGKLEYIQRLQSGGIAKFQQPAGTLIKVGNRTFNDQKLANAYAQETYNDNYETASPSTLVDNAYNGNRYQRNHANDALVERYGDNWSRQSTALSKYNTRSIDSSGNVVYRAPGTGTYLDSSGKIQKYNTAVPTQNTTRQSPVTGVGDEVSSKSGNIGGTAPHNRYANVTEGEKTKVRAWQLEHGLKADGIWGPNTQKAYEAEQVRLKQVTPMQTDNTGTSYYNNEKSFQASLKPSNAASMFKGINLQPVGSTTPLNFEQTTPTRDLKSYAIPVRFKKGGYLKKKTSSDNADKSTVQLTPGENTDYQLNGGKPIKKGQKGLVTKNTSDEQTKKTWMKNTTTSQVDNTKDELGQKVNGKTGNMSGDELSKMINRGNEGSKAIAKLKNPAKKEKGGYLKNKVEEEKCGGKMKSKPKKGEQGMTATEIGKEKSYKRVEVVPAAKKGMKSKTKKCSSGCGCKKTIIHKQGGVLSTVCSCCGSRCN